MKFSIIHIEPLSGQKAQVYSLKYEGKYVSELQLFADKFNDSDQKIIHELFQRIYTISTRDGIQESFFRRECPEPYNVFRLLETGKLRLYCIMFSDIILLFGAGGEKTFNTLKNKENPHLETEIKKMMQIEDCINGYIKSGKHNKTEKGFVGKLDNLIYKGSYEHKEKCERTEVFSQLLNSIPEEVKESINLSMAIAVQINYILKNKKISQRDFAAMLGKKEFEISKWLSGNHNFTTNTISKIQKVLGEEIVTIPMHSKTKRSNPRIQ